MNKKLECSLWINVCWKQMNKPESKRESACTMFHDVCVCVMQTYN